MLVTEEIFRDLVKNLDAHGRQLIGLNILVARVHLAKKQAPL